MQVVIVVDYMRALNRNVLFVESSLEYNAPEMTIVSIAVESGFIGSGTDIDTPGFDDGYDGPENEL